MSPNHPGLEALDLDGLGLGKRGANVIGKPDPAAFGDPAAGSRNMPDAGNLLDNFTTSATPISGGVSVAYHHRGEPAGTPPSWTIESDGRGLRLISQWSAASAPEPLPLIIDARICHASLLGLFNADGRIALPAVLHFPGRGSLRITTPAAKDATLEYLTGSKNFIRITFPSATQATPRIAFDLTVTAIHPELPEIGADRRFDAFRRNWLNILQLNPELRVLANNVASTPCGLCYYKYADIATHTPPLADGLSALDLMRQTMDAMLAGKKTYGMPGSGSESGSAYPVESADTFPSLVIAAGICAAGDTNAAWLRAHYAGIKAWAERMLATDINGNGLIEYSPATGNSGSWNEGEPKVRPSNWWDAIGFGHEDAYANALAYRALHSMARMAASLDDNAGAARYRAAADKLKAAYFPAFYNPDTGILGGWRSADGQLHDYWFLFVNGIAIDYGLVAPERAAAIADRLLNKIKEVGYTRFDMGLPGNLVSIARKDYAHKVRRWGGGRREDNADGFQIYENGGATACFAYFTLAALYDLGRREAADQILLPMLGGFDQCGFEGQGANGMTNDWRKWDGTPMGYEGFLVDNYYALLAVVARARGGHLFSEKEPPAAGAGTHPAP